MAQTLVNDDNGLRLYIDEPHEIIVNNVGNGFTFKTLLQRKDATRDVSIETTVLGICDGNRYLVVNEKLLDNGQFVTGSTVPAAASTFETAYDFMMPLFDKVCKP
jgi:hypothetical protein